MANVLMVIAKIGFRDEEFLEPKAILEGKSHKITVASTEPGTCQGKLGATTEADIALEKADPDDFDGVVFVGGPGSKEFFHDQSAHDLARNMYDSGKVVSAICIGPNILANAGILQGKRATAYPSVKDSLKEKGATFTDEKVTEDGKLVTANGPEAATRFGETVESLLH